MFESCAQKSGRLSDTTSLGISEIQTTMGIWKSGCLLHPLANILKYQDRFDWDYEKIKGIFDLYEGGYASLITPDIDKEYCKMFSYKMWCVLENNKIKLTED